MTRKETEQDIRLEISVQVLEWFKQLTGFTNREFTEYMNKYNMWAILDNQLLMESFIYADERDIIQILGKYLSKEEQDKIISQNNKR